MIWQDFLVYLGLALQLGAMTWQTGRFLLRKKLSWTPAGVGLIGLSLSLIGLSLMWLGMRG